MNRRKGTSRPDVLTTYRELAPAPELRAHVRAYFSFIPGGASWRGSRSVTREVRFAPEESFCSPVFADGRASLVMELGATCHLGQGWIFGTPVRARAIGALRTVGGATASACPEMIGVYLEPGSPSALFEVPAIELTDQIVDLDHLWGPRSTRLAEDLAALDEQTRVDRLEAALLERVQHAPRPRPGVDVAGLARWAWARPTRMTVRRLADAAGVSRRHLTRMFRQVVGVTPKRYCRLARFHAGLVYAGAGPGVKWAQVAAELGYADQSHTIAEFRELSSLTPEALATQGWFHPFILQARSTSGTACQRRV